MGRRKKKVAERQEIVDNRQFSAFFLWTGLTFYLSGCMIQGVEVEEMSRKGQEGVPDGYKRCSKCGEVKEAFEFIGGMCRPCVAEYHKEYWKKNSGKLHDKRKKYNMEYYKKNRDRCLERSKENYKKNTKIVKEHLPCGEKRCTKCGVIKKYDDFSISKTGKDGRNAQCKLCRKEYDKIHGIKYRAKIRENTEEYTRRKQYEAAWRERLDEEAKQRYRLKEKEAYVKKHPKKEKEVLPVGMKRCSKCGEVKEASMFSKGSNKDGFKSQCKSCSYDVVAKERNKKHYIENRDRIRIVSRAYYEKNQISEQAKRYFAKNGLKRSQIPECLFNLKISQIVLYRGIKSHKEVTNG